MKLQDLNSIKERVLSDVLETTETTRVLVGLATCGIASGAVPVMEKLTELAAGNEKISVSKTGCIGICQYEPVVEVEVPGEEKVTYVKVAPEMVARIVNDHLVNHNVVTEFTIGAMDK